MRSLLYTLMIFPLLILSGSANAQILQDTFEAKLYNEDKEFFFADVTTSIISEDGYIYVGTKDLGLLRINDNNHKIFQTGDMSGRHHDRVFCLYEDKNSTLWIGDEVGFQSYDKKLERFTSRAKSFFKTCHTYNSGIKAIYRIDDNTLILGTKAGLLEYDIRQDSIVQTYLDKDLIFSNYDSQYHLLDITEDDYDHNIFWIASRSGVYRFDNSSKSVTNMISTTPGEGFRKVISYGDSLILLSENGSAIYEYDINRNKLTLYYEQTHELYIDNQSQGYHKTTFLDLKKVDANYALVNSRASGPMLLNINKGDVEQLYLKHPELQKLDRYEHESSQIDKYLKDCLWAVIDKSGRLSGGHIREFYFRTLEPVIQNISNKKEGSTILGIEKYYINNKEVQAKDIYGRENNFILKYYQRDIGFKFTERNPAPNFNYRYEYRLNDQEWKSALQNNMAIFTDLSGGNHTIKYRSILNDAIIHTDNIAIEVEKIWHEKWLYRLGILASLISGIFIFLFYRKKQKDEKSKLLDQLANLEMSVLRTQMNPHFLFNSINSINQYILTEEPAKASDYLTKFSRLMRNILNNSKNQLIPIAEEIKTLVLYMDLENLRYEDMFEYNIKIDPKIDQTNCLVPPLLLQPYIENAIRHGIAPLKNKIEGLISIKITTANNSMKIVIEDNGIGIKNSKKNNERKVIKRESHGINITNDRVNLINKVQGRNRASVNITDKQNGNVTQPGTRVTIILPIITQE